jgi:hypothetical protein
LPKAGNQRVFAGQTIRTHALGNTRTQDLLRPPSAYTEDDLHNTTINQRLRTTFERNNDVIQITRPSGFCRHVFQLR